MDGIKVFVTGGSGFIGRRLVSRLVAHGYLVSVLMRNAKAALRPEINVVVGDLAMEKGFKEATLASCDVIFHCAGETKDIGLMRGVHVDGTRRLLDAADRAARVRGKPIHWVQLSSVGAYGPPVGPTNTERVVTESTLELPVGEYEITKTASDRLVVEASMSGSLTYTILRPSNVFGPQMPNQSLRALIAVVQRGLFFYIGRPGAIATYVHVADVVGALVKCGIAARAKGQTFNISSDCPLEELIRGIATAVGVRPPRVRFQEGVVRAIVAALSGIVSLPLDQKRINALVSRTTFPTSKIERELDIRSFRYVPDAIRELVTERH